MVWRSDRPWGTALVLAGAGGALGAIAGTLWGFGLQGSFLDSNVGAAGMGGLCAGLGWVAGSALGLARSRHGHAPTRTWVWILRAGAIAFLATGILVARSLPSLDTHRPLADLGPMQRDILIDALLAAATLLVCARPAVPVRRMLVGTTSVAAIALIVLGRIAAGAIPEGRGVAWSDAWWARQDTTHLPAALLDPAPRACPNDIPTGSRLEPRAFAYNMLGRLPHVLPEGFGLQEWSGPGGEETMRTIGIWPLTPDTHAYVEANGLWSDGRCRAISLVLFSVPGLGRPGDVDGPTGATVGAWTVVRDTPDPCANALTGPGGCLEYESQPVDRDGQILILQMRGIGRGEGDSIALSIPTGHLDAHPLG